MLHDLIKMSALTNLSLINLVIQHSIMIFFFFFTFSFHSLKHSLLPQLSLSKHFIWLFCYICLLVLKTFASYVKKP